MPNREEVLEALTYIADPDYHRSMVELNLIRDVMVKEGHAALSLIYTGRDEKDLEPLKREVRAALAKIGIPDVHIRVRSVTEHDRQEIEKKIGAPQPAPASANRTRTQAEMAAPGGSQLLAPDSGVTFIAVASGKGGVGKSTVTVNLAVALARQGKKVGIIDADIYGFSVPDMMGIEERPQVVENRIVPVERFGVKVISMGFFVQDNAPIIWRGPMLGKMLRNFFNEVEWGDVEIVLLDLPPGTGDVALDVHQMIPHSKEIIVTTPHATAAFVAARAGAMALQTNHEILGIVENMAYYVNRDGEKDYIFGRGGGAKLAQELHADLIAQIPLGAPDNHTAEPDYSPSVYKADTTSGQMYLEMADRVIRKLA